MPKGWGQWKFPTLGPPGPPEPLFRGQTPQNREIAYFARNVFLPFGRSCRTLKNIHTIPKKLRLAFFGPFLTQKHQKRAKFKRDKKEGAPGLIFDLTLISKPKILEFYHTLRKTRNIDVKGEIGPIKVRPYFDRPNPTLNVNFPRFSQSMMKFSIFE